jgi:hypothetical protein
VRRGSFGLLAILVALGGSLPAADDARAARLLDVGVADAGGATEVRLRLDGPPPEIDESRLPGRVVVDLKGVAAALRSQRVTGAGPCLTRVRVGEHPGFVRVVLDLARDCELDRRVAGETVILSLASPRGASAGAPAPEPTPPAGRRSAGVLLKASGEQLLPVADAPADAAADRPVPAEGGSEPGAAVGAPSPSEALEKQEVPEPEPAAPPEDLPAASPEPDPDDTEDPEEAEAPPPEQTRQALPDDGTTTDETSLGLLPAVPPVPVRPRRSPAPADREGALVSIEFKDTDVRTVLDLVARAGGHRVIFLPEVKGRVTVKALDRPWRDVFAEILRKARLESVEHEDLLLVEPLGTR